MCHKLLQVYVCNHSKTICTTPCPHALETGSKVPLVKGLSRSDSTVSSIRHNNDAAQVRSPPTSPARSELPPTSPPQTPAPAPAFRLILPAQPSSHISPPPDYTPTLQTSPLLPDEGYTIDPNFCDYYFPRHVPRSQVPCEQCYMLPEWVHMSKRWMKWYKEQHPMEKVEDLERDSGVRGVRERYERRK